MEGAEPVSDYTLDEWFVVALARTIRDREVVFHGFASPCAQIAMHVARKTHAREMLLIEGATYAINPDPQFIPTTSNVLRHGLSRRRRPDVRLGWPDRRVRQH